MHRAPRFHTQDSWDSERRGGNRGIEFPGRLRRTDPSVCHFYCCWGQSSIDRSPIQLALLTTAEHARSRIFFSLPHSPHAHAEKIYGALGCLSSVRSDRARPSLFPPIRFAARESIVSRAFRENALLRENETFHGAGVRRDLREDPQSPTVVIRPDSTTTFSRNPPRDLFTERRERKNGHSRRDTYSNLDHYYKRKFLSPCGLAAVQTTYQRVARGFRPVMFTNSARSAIGPKL